MKLRKILSYLLFFLFFLLFGLQVFFEITPGVLVSAGEKSVIMLLLFSLATVATCLIQGSLESDAAKRRAVKVCIWLLFSVYIFNLAVLLFFDQGFRLTGFHKAQDFNRYVSENVNLVPFSTITRYLNAWRRHSIGMYYVAVNLLGNLFAFAPFGFFLPVIRPACFLFRRFITAMTAVIVFAEGMQFFFRVGSCDIDDFLLNFLGAFLVFLIVRTKPVKAFFIKYRILRTDMR